MKKPVIIIFFLTLSLILCGFSFNNSNSNDISFDINDLYNYQKQYNSEEVEVCSSSDVKTYMDYRLTADPSSAQFWFIRNNLSVDKTGFLYDKDGFIAAALGSFYGSIGDRYYFTLDTGIVLPIVKAEEKANRDVYGGCYHRQDGSVIEFVIDTDKAQNYFGTYANGYVLQGNYNNFGLTSGSIIKVEKVVGDKIGNSIFYYNSNENPIWNDSYNYASGY